MSKSRKLYHVTFKGKRGYPPCLIIRAGSPVSAFTEAVKVLKRPEYDEYGRPFTIQSVTFEGTLDN
jgi:hypothetical protein